MELLLAISIFLSLAALLVSNKIRVMRILKILDDPLVVLKLDKDVRAELINRFSSFFYFVEPSPSKMEFPIIYEVSSGKTIFFCGQIMKYSTIALVAEVSIGIIAQNI